MNPGQRYIARTYSQLSQLDVNMPEWQRLTSAKHVQMLYESMYSSIIQDASHPPILPGCMIFCHNLPSLWILIDGQHRFLALKKLFDDHGIDLSIMCCDITIEDETRAQHWFEVVNKTLPLGRLPKHQTLTVPNQVLRELQRIYPKCFSDTDNPRRPHLNQQLAIRLTHVPGIEIWKADKIVERLLKYNTYLQQQPWTAFKYPGDTQTTVEKYLSAAAKKGNLLLGMFKNYEFLEDCFQSHTANFNLQISPKKKPISSALRKEVWKRYNGDMMTGKCYVCPTHLIDFHSFHAGHIIAESKGGKTILSNLRPVCSNCNTSCGTRNLDVFKLQFQ